MGRANTGGTLTPFDQSDGTIPDPSGELGPGGYVLAANTTYIFLLSIADGAYKSVTVRWPTGFVIDQMVIETTDLPGRNAEPLVDDGWLPEETLTVKVIGGTASSGEVTSDGSQAGAARFNLSSCAARYARLRVKTGAAGGPFVVADWGKE